jgi:PAS domain S-box-containing protein
VVVRRRIALSTSAEALNGLVGAGAVVKIGNSDGDGWTNLSTVVGAPPATLSQLGVAGYAAPDGARRLGALTSITDTPWSVWVEFPESVVLAPAHSFLRRMLVIALAGLVVAGLVLRVMTQRILAPLSELTCASEAIAAGEYSRRVTVARRDEIGRLGLTFNAMTEQVEWAHRDLEDRVRQRTATIEETLVILGRHVQELKDSREEMDQFFLLTPDMLCIADVEGRFTRVNAAWHDVLGWTSEDLTSAPYVSFVHPDDVEATARETAKLVDGDISLTFENRYRCKDGSFRWLSWRAAPALSRGLIYATARDVTTEKRAACDLADHAAELEAVNRELEAFSYSVSHDLRAPLRHIGGFAALLRQTAATSLDAKGHRLLETIVSAATRMGRLIDDLLAFSRVGRTALEPTDVSLNLLVRDVHREIMTGVDNREIVWGLNDLPAVRGDRALLRLVFTNLLSNAVKYSSTRAHAMIEVGAVRGSEHEVVVCVRDNGVGFDMKYVSKLFGVFQRLHSAEEFEGTGIGLANVQRIVHRHGGRVWAEGEVNRGAAFFVSLPQASHA